MALGFCTTGPAHRIGSDDTTRTLVLSDQSASGSGACHQVNQVLLLSRRKKDGRTERPGLGAVSNGLGDDSFRKEEVSTDSVDFDDNCTESGTNVSGSNTVA